MNYEAIWKLMSDLVTELRKSGESIPAGVMKDLRSAKTMIEILKMDRTRSENLSRIEEYLNNVESYLLPAAERKFGIECVEEWMDKILEAQRSDQTWKTELPKRFPIGLPRDKRWVRIGDLREFPLEKIKHLSEEAGLTYKIQEDGHVLVYGEEEKVKSLVKKMVELRESER